MDSELRELERLFEAAQQAKPTARLSERNVVELVVKLQQLGLLDADLLHTVSGKEYITQERLRQEMEAEISRLGRVSLIDLASTVGVDLYHCERQAEQIVASNPGLTLVQGDVISTSYWDNLAEEVNETLKEASQISLGELARRYNLGAELLTGILSSRIGTLVHAKLEGGQLYTPAYVARVKATVCGALRALTVPTSLQRVWTSLQSQLRDRDEGGVTGVTGEGGLFHMVLNELLAEGAIKGSLRGGGASWTPAVFAHSQRESVEAFFSQNAYVSYNALKKLNVPQPKQYLQTKYPEGIALETVFMHASFIGMLDSAAEEAIIGGGWLDALDVVPHEFGSSDTGKLLLLCPSVQKALKDSAATVMVETCVVSATFIKALLERFQSLLRESQEKAVTGNQKAANEDIKKQNEGEKNLEEGDNTKQPNAKPKKAEKRQKETNTVKSTEIVEDEDMNGKSGRNKKKSGKSRGSKTASGKESSLKGNKTSDREASGEADVPSEETLAEKLVEWFPDLEAAGTEDGYGGVLPKSLAIQLRPPLVSYMMALRRAHLSATIEERRQRVDALQQKLNEDYASLQLFSKALGLFDDDKGMEALLHKHLLRTTAAEIADVFLEAQVLEHRLENSEGNGAQPPLPSKPFTTATRLSLAKSLPGSLSATAVEMVEALEGKNIAAFDSGLEVAVRESGLRLKKLDKKGERTLLHAYRKNLADQVELEDDPVALLPKVVALLYVQVHGRALQAPGRAMSTAVTRLKKAIPDETYAVLEEYHAATVALLATTTTTTTADSDCSPDRVGGKKELLQKRMPELKAITQVAPDKEPRS